MLEVFKAFARYNAKANGIVMGHLKALDEGGLCRDYGTFYPTLTDTVLHVMGSDARWLGRLAAFRDAGFDVSRIESIKADCKADPVNAYRERARIAGLRSELDADIIKTADAIPEAALALPFEIQFGDRKISPPLWQLLLQWFNHQTHHRGAVSAMLDMAGAENDFSLVLDKIA